MADFKINHLSIHASLC